MSIEVAAQKFLFKPSNDTSVLVGPFKQLRIAKDQDEGPAKNTIFSQPFA